MLLLLNDFKESEVKRNLDYKDVYVSQMYFLNKTMMINRKPSFGVFNPDSVTDHTRRNNKSTCVMGIENMRILEPV